MTKQELYTKMQEVLTKYKVAKKASDEILALVEPRKKYDAYPPKVDKDGNIVELWCNKHLKYEPIENFRKSAKNKTGYEKMCKAAEKFWWDRTKEYKELEKTVYSIQEQVIDGKITIDKAKKEIEKIKKEIEKIKSLRDTLPYK